jgi:hypothetical protein
MSNETLTFFNGFCAGSFVWILLHIIHVRYQHKKTIDAAHEQYLRGYHHGRKSLSLYHPIKNNH